MCLLPSLKWSSTISSLGIVQWDFTRWDHPRNPGRVFGSGPVINMNKWVSVEGHMEVVLSNSVSMGSWYRSGTKT